MKDILKLYRDYCEFKKIQFTNYPSIRSWDASTLFCPAGMQQYKDKFRDSDYTGVTIANNQSCLRMNDIAEVGDGTHFAYFNMLGLFSFRDWEMERAIGFWIEFIEEWCELKIDYVTIHPKKMNEWKTLYPADFKVIADEDCVWGDGGIEGYCTEFYVDGVEVGNIVRPRGDCIDAGFGLERIESLVNGLKPQNRVELLKQCALKILESGFKPSNKEQGYVLRKILREIYKSGSILNHEVFEDELIRQYKIKERFPSLLKKNPKKSKEWWFDTHGIEIDQL